MRKCSKCEKDGDVRRLTDGLCATCLNAKALTQLPQKQEIGPGDSLSMIGVKRQRELMEEELSYSS